MTENLKQTVKEAVLLYLLREYDASNGNDVTAIPESLLESVERKTVEKIEIKDLREYLESEGFIRNVDVTDKHLVAKITMHGIREIASPWKWQHYDKIISAIALRGKPYLQLSELLGEERIIITSELLEEMKSPEFGFIDEFKHENGTLYYCLTPKGAEYYQVHRLEFS